jgi:hypothetical protein
MLVLFEFQASSKSETSEKTRPSAGNNPGESSRSKAPEGSPKACLEDSLETKNNGKKMDFKLETLAARVCFVMGLWWPTPPPIELNRNQRRGKSTEIVVAICLECPWTRCFHGLAHIDRALQTRRRALLSWAATGWRTGPAPPGYPILFYFTCAIPFPKRHT